MSDRKVNRSRAVYEILRGLLVFIIVAAMGITILIIAVRQTANGKKTDHTLAILRQVKQTNEFIIDCTTVGHKCYDDAQKSSASTIGNIKQVIVLASSCAATLPHPTPPNVQRCVEDGPK